MHNKSNVYAATRSDVDAYIRSQIDETPATSQDKDLAPALPEEMVVEIMTEIMTKLKFTGSKMCDAKDGKDESNSSLLPRLIECFAALIAFPGRSAAFR